MATSKNSQINGSFVHDKVLLQIANSGPTRQWQIAENIAANPNISISQLSRLIRCQKIVLASIRVMPEDYRPEMMELAVGRLEFIYWLARKMKCAS